MRRPRPRSPRFASGAADAGSAVVDFVLVSILVSALTLGVLQLALALHVRNTLIWCAGEGARVGARSGSSPEQGAERARALISESLTTSYADDVRASQRVEGGVPLVGVEVSAPLPLVAWWGPRSTVSVRGRAFAEAPG